MDTEEETELLTYREKVIAELERRVIRVRELEVQISKVEGAITASTRERRVIVGVSGRNQVKEAHKKRLKGELGHLYKERDVAVLDLQKAESRLKEVDHRLKDVRKEPRE